MKSNKGEHILPAKKTVTSLAAEKAELSSELAARFALYPENRRRPVNKTLFRNDYFQLTYNMKDRTLTTSSRGDLVYSAIPYDTARNYIQRAAIQYLLHPEETRRYIELHKADLETYLMLSIFQITGKRVAKDSPEVQEAYEAIVQNPLFEIQILGRLLQHDETGALSANLAGKFLFSENAKTGIAGYISEYLKFVVQLTQTLPIIMDGRTVTLLDTMTSEPVLLEMNSQKSLSSESDIGQALKLLPADIKQTIERSLVVADQSTAVNNRPMLRSEVGKELSAVRKNYVAHSVHPDELEQYFENVLPTENSNRINVVSDFHVTDGKFPFTNRNFNILAGDVSTSGVINEEIRGLLVMGNHDLTAVLPKAQDLDTEEWEKWAPFFKNEWFKRLLRSPEDAWHLLPVGDHPYYEVVKRELDSHFPQMAVLNNSSIIHEGVRYIGLTIPVALARRKKQQQAFILKTLKRLLHSEYNQPTVIVSHAPLFNELSMLSPKSTAYNKSYVCSNLEIEKLFENYNILGAIHGHHHIPASLGRYKWVSFAGKELFVVCSIYSKLNTGFELLDLLNLNPPLSK